MERDREVRRASIVGSNGFNRRRHKTDMLRDSPDEDGGVELPESVRLRDRTKKDRDRERKRERERERERDLRERSSRSKKGRGERLISNRDDRVDETSDESLNDDDYEYDEDADATRLIPISNHSLHSSLSQQHSSNNTNSVIISSNHLQHRKSFPPAASSSSSEVFKASPSWKPDEIISVSVPRKARSASTKRSHDWTSTSSNNNSGGGGEQVHRQASTSPARQGGALTSMLSPAAPMSPPSSSNAPYRKKLKSGGSNGGQKLKPPKAAAKQTSSNPEELEIEIAEVLYGLMTQSQAPSKKEDYREGDKSNGDVKPHVSSQISNSNSANKQILGPNSSPLQPVAPKRKRPRQMADNSQLDMDKTAKSEMDKFSSSNGENVSETGGNSALQGPPAAEPLASASVKINLKLKDGAEGSRESRDMSSPQEKISTAVRNEGIICMDTTSTASASSTIIKANALVSDVGNQRRQKMEIDLMAPPPQVRSSPDREIKIHLKAVVTAADQKSSLSIDNMELKTDVLANKVDEKRKIGKEQSENAAAEDSKEKWIVQEVGLKKEIENKVGSVVGVQLDLEKPVRNGNAAVNSSGNKLQLYNDKQQQQDTPFKANREEPLSEKSSQSKSSLPLAMPMASWPGGLPPMGYMAPLQGVIPMDGNTVAPAPIQTLFSQPRPKRCATHSYIARSIQCLQQVMKMNPFWHAAAGSASLFGSKPESLNLMHADLHGNIAGRGIINAAPSKGNELASNSNHSGREDKGSQTAVTSERKQPMLIQQPLPPVAATNLLGPAFIFPLNQQQAAVAARPSSAASVGGSTSGASGSVAMSFIYPAAMAANETQYLAIMQNNGYTFPIPAVGAPPNYRGNPALFNAPPFYSPQMIQQAHSNNCSQSQKHIQRPQSSGGADANSQEVPALNSQQSNNPPPPYPPRPRHFDGSETDRSRPSLNTYGGQNFVMPIHPHNFTLLTPPPTALAATASANGSSNQSEKQQAMSFGTSVAQNHTKSSSEANIQMAAQKKHFRVCEDDNSVGSDAERKSSTAKGQSIAFSRSESANSSAQANCGNVSSGNATSAAINLPNNHTQQQQQHATNRSKASNGNLSSEHVKFPIGFQSSSSSPSQWRSSSTRAYQTPSNLSQQQHSRSISFGGKSCQGNRDPSSPPMMVASSRTTASASASTNTKISSQQPKNSPSSVPSQKSPSNLGQPVTSSTSSSGAQLLFSNPYSQAQSAYICSSSEGEQSSRFLQQA